MIRAVVASVFLFVVASPDLFAQTLTAPKQAADGGLLIGDKYRFTWTRVSHATYYHLWVTDVTGAQHKEWIPSSAAHCAGEEMVCSVTRDLPLPTGAAYWWVQAWAPDTYGPWSPAHQLVVAGRVGGDANSNTILGRAALQSVSASSADGGSVQDTVAIGNEALRNFKVVPNVGTGANTALGAFALHRLTPSWSLSTASGNTALGWSTLSKLSNGHSNIAIGADAGSNLPSGNMNIYIGTYGGPYLVSESNTIRLGRQYDHTRTFIAGAYGVTSAGGVGLFVNSAGQLGTTTSSMRFKQGIRPINGLSERLHELRPVYFEYKPSIDPDGLPQYGLIAEEVEKVFPELVVRNEEGKPETVRYHLLVPLLLGELQKQAKQLSDQAEEMKALAKQVEALSKAHQQRRRR